MSLLPLSLSFLFIPCHFLTPLVIPYSLILISIFHVLTSLLIHLSFLDIPFTSNAIPCVVQVQSWKMKSPALHCIICGQSVGTPESIKPIHSLSYASFSQASIFAIQQHLSERRISGKHFPLIHTRYIALNHFYNVQDMNIID